MQLVHTLKVRTSYFSSFSLHLPTYHHTIHLVKPIFLRIPEKYSRLKTEETQRKQNWDAIKEKLKEMNLNENQTQ